MNDNGSFAKVGSLGAVPSGGGHAPGSKARVMVVDDDPIVLEITRARLEGAGYAVTTRDEGIGTVRAICSEKPDLVLLDINMPAISGDSIAGLVQRAQGGADTAIVFHSSGGLVSLQRRAREAGVLGAIPKTESDQLFVAQFDRLIKLARRRKGES